MNPQSRCGPRRAGRWRLALLVSLLAALSLLVSASAVHAADPLASELPAVQGSAPPTAPGQPSGQESQPAPGAESPAPPAPAPEVEAAQAPEDVAGGNEYQEQGVPLGTGEDAEPVDPGAEPDSEQPSTPAEGSVETPATGTEALAAAPETASPTSTLPQTGAEAWLLALVGVALLGLGFVLRRVGGARAAG